MRSFRRLPWRELAFWSLLIVISGLVLYQTDFFESAGNGKAKSQLIDNYYIPKDFTQKKPLTVARKALARLNSESPKKWYVRWNMFTGLPRMMTGTGEKSRAQTNEEIAKTFVKKHLALLVGMEDSIYLSDFSFEVKSSGFFRTFTSIGLRTYYRGIEVLNGGLSADVNNEGQVISISNSLTNIQSIDLNPSISAEDADRIIRETAGQKEVMQVEGPLRLGIYQSTPARLAYHGYRKVGIWTWRFMIDAHTGELIMSRRLGHDDDLRNPDAPRAPEPSPADTLPDSAYEIFKNKFGFDPRTRSIKMPNR